MQDAVAAHGAKPARYPTTIDGSDDQLLLCRRHSLWWFDVGVCSFELVTDLVDLRLLLGFCIDKLLEHLVARCGRLHQVVHVALQMIHKVGGSQSFSRPARIYGGVGHAKGFFISVRSEFPKFLHIAGFAEFALPFEPQALVHW